MPDMLQPPCEHYGNFKIPNWVTSTPRSLPLQSVNTGSVMHLILTQAEDRLWR